MAAQPPFINVRKYTVVWGCGGWRCGGREGKNYGVVPSREGGAEISFHCGILRIQTGIQGGTYGKIWKPK